MTVCYPQIITARLCPRNELTFSATPPNCVRVVPVYNDASYVLSQFPPPVHFFVTDNGLVYQLADIQSPPSTPPEYHAVLDSTGCILIGVELSSVTTAPLTAKQISVLPGVLRHVLQTLGLPLTSVTNTLPPQRCRPQLWQEIVQATTLCLNTSPPPPPNPPALSCSFVISCLQPGQNINISAGGTISAGQLVPGPNNDQYTWLAPNGNPLFSFSTAASSLSVQDTNTIDLTLAGNVLSADVIVSPNAGNQIQVLPNGLYVPPSSASITVQDTNTVDLTLVGGVLSANVFVSGSAGNQIQVLPDGLYVPPSTFNLNVQDTPTVDLILSGSTLSANVNISSAPNNGITINPDGLFVPATANPCLTFPPNLTFPPTNNYLVSYNVNTGCLEQLYLSQEAVVYGNVLGTGTPQLVNLLYHPQRNFLRGVLAGSAIMDNSIAMLNGGTIGGNFSVNSLAIMRSSSVTNDVIGSLVSLDNFNVGASFNNVIVGSIGGVSIARFSTIVAENSPISNIEFSTLHSRSSNVGGVNFSFTILDQAITGSIFASTAIVLNQPTSALPNVVHSALYGRSTYNQVGGSAVFSFSLVTSDNTTYQQIQYDFSTIHARNSLFRNDSPYEFSFIAVSDSTLRGAVNSVLLFSSLPAQQPIVNYSVATNGNNNTNPPRVGPSAPSLRTSLFLSPSQILPDMSSAVYASTDVNLFDSITTSVIAAVEVAEFDSSPPTNTARVQSSLLVGRGLDISSVPVVSSLTLVGDNLVAGTQTVFGVGTQSYQTPAIIAAGGWRAYIADGGDSVNQNYFQGWASAWRFRPFNAATNYPNNGAAVAALNAAYGTDPRIAIGTMSVARVAGVPAIFVWNGTTFVRITV